MKHTLALIALLSMNFAMANEALTIKKPIELSNGEFSEGTITRLTSVEVAEFIPWAQNARKILENALLESALLPFNERVGFISHEIKSVVRASGSKQYQMLMRFALNRGLLLTGILAKEADPRDVGTMENQLDILTSSIRMAVKLYESDISFQQRLKEDRGAVEINQAQFGREIGIGFFNSSKNIFDASAQYLIMRKTYEMLNWDLSQDKDSKNHSEDIVEIYRTLERLPEGASNDQNSLSHVRRLNYLGQKVFGHQVPKFERHQETTNANKPDSVQKASMPLGDFSLVTAKRKSFKMMKTEVTQMMWVNIMKYNPSAFASQQNCPDSHLTVEGVKMCPNFPVESVSIDDIEEFLYQLKQEGIGNYALPTVNQWKQAASDIEIARNKYTYPRSSSNARFSSHEVATMEPNFWGVFDLYDNVTEFVLDDKNASQIKIAGGLSKGTLRSEPSVQGPYGDITPQTSGENLGFRLVEVQ